MKIALATTTIYVPRLLDAYAEHAIAYQNETGNEVFFVVAGDRKTPTESIDYCTKLQEKSGLTVTYLTPEEQLNMVEGKPFSAHIDWDCIQRRNFSGLFAYQQGADVIIYIDDDNFLESGNYFHEHLNSLESVSLPSLSSDSGFLNIMQGAKGSHVSNWLFPRGFPFAKRLEDPQSSIQINGSWESGGVCNAGLWIEEPDIDAASRIVGRPLVETYEMSSSSLRPGTWSPINSQNTAFTREIFPAYFLSSKVGRYDDIYAGYVMQAISGSLNKSVSFGKPIVRQKRNDHDLMVDLANEISGMSNIDFVCDFLRKLEITGENVRDCLASLLRSWERELLMIPRGHKAVTDLRNLLLGYQLWFDVIYSK